MSIENTGPGGVGNSYGIRETTFPSQYTAGSSARTNYIEYSSSTGVPVTGQGSTVSTIGVTDNVVFDNTAGKGIKLDIDTPAFGWRDITADIQVRGSGAADPAFAVYGATVMRAYSFSATVNQEVFLVFHMPHDWVVGTPIYFHAHWSNAAATPNTGNVVWSFDYSFAKGFNQEAFPAIQTVSVTQASPATRYQHMVAETVAVTIPTLEVDGLILVRGYRNATAVNDTCTDAVFLHTMDIHYQSSNIATKNKAPNFYN